MHLGDFVDKNRWWGVISEQSIESYHALVNKDLKRRQNTKDLNKILKFLAHQQVLRNAIFDNCI